MAARAASWFANEVSPAAARSAGDGQETGKDTRLEEPYAHWQIDEEIFAMRSMACVASGLALTRASSSNSGIRTKAR